jgi:cytochrome c oxidase cbb3-type subunit 3
MPTKSEKDTIAGKATTGHEWDGIRELDTPLPKWWVYVLYATIVWAVVYFILYPAIPGISGYTKGVLGYDSRAEVAQRIEAARLAQKSYLDRVRVASLDEIRTDRDLMSFVLAGGKSAFADNCAPCHGLGGAGRAGYPSLADDVWIWGGRMADIEKTIRVGIRGDHKETRTALMPSFGADGVLKPPQIADAAEFVLSLSRRSGDPASAERGAKLYAEQCVACHGDKGHGNAELGAPRLDTRIFLYGAAKEDIVRQIARPQHGVMPAWAGRLDETTIKMLAIYVHSLGGGR